MLKLKRVILITLSLVLFSCVGLGCSDDPQFNIDYISEIDMKINRIKDIEANNTISDRWFFITDLHWESNDRNSPGIMRYIQSRTSVKTVVFGGDYISYNYKDKEYAVSLMAECVNSFGIKNYYAIIGNHETNQSASTDMPLITDYESNVALNKGRFEKPYFCVKDDNNKVCKIFLNTNAFSKDDEQYIWLKQTLIMLDSDVTAFVFMHIYNDYKNPGVPLTVAPVGNLLNEMLGDIADEMTCSIGGIFSGHTHRDFMDKDALGYTIVSTACDARDSYYACDDLYERNDGEFSEQAFDVVQVDTSNRKVFLTRIGAGYDREYTY